jgi:hypothetical protein
MSDYKLVSVDTISGPKPIPAPDGWDYNKTDVTVWLWLLNKTSELNDAMTNKKSKVRDRHGLNEQINILAIVLGNAVGMSSSYWIMEARRILPVLNEMERKRVKWKGALT